MEGNIKRLFWARAALHGNLQISLLVSMWCLPWQRSTHISSLLTWNRHQRWAQFSLPCAQEAISMQGTHTASYSAYMYCTCTRLSWHLHIWSQLLFMNDPLIPDIFLVVISQDMCLFIVHNWSYWITLVINTSIVLRGGMHVIKCGFMWVIVKLGFCKKYENKQKQL